MTAPVLPIPIRGPERLAWLNTLDEAVAVDVVRAAQELVDEQAAPPEVAAEMASGFARYLSCRIADAAAMAADLFLATAS